MMIEHEKNAPYYKLLGVKYIGQQERTRGEYSLDTFNDLVTGSTFLRRPFESLEMAIERVRELYRRR